MTSVPRDGQTSSMPTPYSKGISQATARPTRRSASVETSIAVRKRRRSHDPRETVQEARSSHRDRQEGPASPYQSDGRRSDHDSDEETSNRYGTTPNAYATPHSNTTNIGAIYNTMGHDGDVVKRDAYLLPHPAHTSQAMNEKKRCPKAGSTTTTIHTPRAIKVLPNG